MAQKIDDPPTLKESQPVLLAAEWMNQLGTPKRIFKRPVIHPPFEALGPLLPWQRRKLEAEALRVNDRYLHEFIEGSSFCPYARQGRRAGQTKRYVHLAETLDLQPLLELFARICSDPQQVVAQVILPMVEVEPEAWRRFCMDLTDLGHAHIQQLVLACAPLHPALPFVESNMYGMVPLFRRAPDPTIQWVRLDGLDALYAGRGSDNQFLKPEDIAALLNANRPSRPPLYDVVCKTNAAMARRLTIERVVKTLDEIAHDGRRAYAQILLTETEPADGASLPSENASANDSKG
jgi:hypothetical protein